MDYNALYSSCFFFDSFSASSARNCSASLPLPPYGKKTRGVREPCSTSITVWLQRRVFQFSLLVKGVSSFWLTWLFAKGLKTLISKMHVFPAHTDIQTSFIRGVGTAVHKASPVKVWRCGSTSTSWHTSLGRNANRSRTSSWLLWTNLSFIHDIAWSTSNLLPRGHVDAMYFCLQQYLRRSAS